MNLYDEEVRKNKKEKTEKLKKSMLIGIIIALIIIIAIIAVLIYKQQNPTIVTTYINDQKVANFDKLLDFETDEYGNTEIYVPIRDVDSYFGYVSYNGEYETKSEDQNECYAVKEDKEVVMYTNGSNRVYTLNLQNKDKEYDYCDIDEAVFENNGKLYTTIQGIEQGYNVIFSYDTAKKVIKVYTLDYLINLYSTALETKTLGNYGIVTIDEDNYNNWKAVLNEEKPALVIKTEDNKYGVINSSDYSFILEPKYDSINYIQYSSYFMVENDGQYGILSNEGKTKVTVAYDEITLMDRNKGIYRIKKDNLYGVITENEKIIVNPEYSQIGIDIDGFGRNGIKNGYLILDELIPAKNDKYWGFYNTKGELVSDGFKYTNIGCKTSNSNNIYGLLTIEDYNLIVVGDKDSYAFMNLSGDDTMFPFVLEKIYIQVANGEESYIMEYNGKQYNVVQYLEKLGISKNSQNNN